MENNQTTSSKEHLEFNDNGVLVSKGILNDEGVAIGYWRYYYSNGVLLCEGCYDDDKRIGKWLGYHKNGNLRYKAYYYNGVKVGSWEHYYENGELEKIVNY